MGTIFLITRAFIVLILASFASTALSVTVNSESGGASLDGAWAFPDCIIEHEPADPGEFDTQEYLIFQGNNVESREVQWASSDGTCSGGETILGSETFTITDEGDVQSLGWDPEPPPPRQDGIGLLEEFPIVTELAILIPGEDSETRLSYIDDTDLIWYLYFDAGEDDAPSLFMSSEEPLRKTDLPLSPIPIPAAAWLFGTALIGFVGMSRRRKIA